MIAIAPYKGAAKAMLDQDWLDLWANKFPTPELAHDMLQNDRLSDRIADVILMRYNVHADLAVLPADQSGADLKSVLSFPRDKLLRTIGLMWQAPVLAPVLPHAQTRQAYGLTSRAELDLALSCRLHTPRSVVGSLETCPDFASDGVSCLVAWFEQFDASLRDRLQLLFPRAETNITALTERAAIVRQFIHDPAAKEVVLQ